LVRPIALFENVPNLSKKREFSRQHKTAPAIVQGWKKTIPFPAGAGTARFIFLLSARFSYYYPPDKPQKAHHI